MARARTIKPSFFKNEDLADLTPEARLLFSGLWCLADREGRLEDRPRKIKAEIFPYDNFDVDSLLDSLQSKKFIIRYEVNEEKYIQISTFCEHQKPHHMEVASEIPAPFNRSNKYNHRPLTREDRSIIIERDNGKCKICGSSDKIHIDHIVPVSRGGTSDHDNLRVLCEQCNLSKGSRSSVSDKRLLTIREQVDNDPINSDFDPLYLESLNPITESLNPISLTPSHEEKNHSEDFETFWERYPKQRIGSKQKAWIAWKQAISRKIDPCEIISGCLAYSASEEVANGFAKGCAAWLNDERWKSDYSKKINRSGEKNAKTGYSDILAAGIRANAGQPGSERNFIPSGIGYSNSGVTPNAFDHQANIKRDFSGSSDSLLQYSPERLARAATASHSGGG